MELFIQSNLSIALQTNLYGPLYTPMFMPCPIQLFSNYLNKTRHIQGVKREKYLAAET